MKIEITPEQWQILVDALRDRQQKCYDRAEAYRHPNCGDYYSETVKFWLDEAKRSREMREFLEKAEKEQQ